MRRYRLLPGGFIALFLVLFAAGSALGLPLDDARPWMVRAGAAAAALAT